MEYLHNGFTLEICPGGFPLSTDSMALAHFAKLPKNAKVLDLGAGCGTIGLMLCAKDSGCVVTGMEQDENAHRTALKNAAANGLQDRLKSLHADLRKVSEMFASGSFSVCISNPPYFTAGPQSQATPLARRDDLCSMEELFTAADWALKYGGDFFLVHKPERLAEICVCGNKHGLEVKRLCLLRHKEDGPVSLLLVQCRKGGKPGLLWEEQSLFDSQGQPTDYYRTLYHL
jgi:tRNA1(Val) A37 N6-methylase TrmN6